MTSRRHIRRKRRAAALGGVVLVERICEGLAELRGRHRRRDGRRIKVERLTSDNGLDRARNVAVRRPIARRAGVKAGRAGAVLAAAMMQYLFEISAIDSLGRGLLAGLGIGLFIVSPWIATFYSFGARPRKLRIPNHCLSPCTVGLVTICKPAAKCTSSKLKSEIGILFILISGGSTSDQKQPARIWS